MRRRVERDVIVSTPAHAAGIKWDSLFQVGIWINRSIKPWDSGTETERKRTRWKHFDVPYCHVSHLASSFISNQKHGASDCN